MIDLSLTTNIEDDKAILTTADLHNDPAQQFLSWFQDEASDNPEQANLAVLATVGLNQQPSSRYVKLMDVDSGFTFYSSATSRKCLDLSVNPKAALCFGWRSITRQVRVEGDVRRLAGIDADGIFNTLSQYSKLVAWASDSKQVIDSVKNFSQHIENIADRFHDQEIPRPQQWQGYRLVPHTFEFVQLENNRFDNRFRYQKESNGWIISQISP